LDGARAEQARRLVLRLNARQCAAGALRSLAELLAAHRAGGRCAVEVEYCGSGARVELLLGPGWQVRPGEALLKQLRELLGVDAVQLRYEQQASVDRNSLG
ncbi:MAG TPA: hypothetical protein PKH28_02715, partial [Candidatus Competibacteraceae bacterium]|nr:hypothetical protein [Candidatus Competibacteraceae bacterium]